MDRTKPARPPAADVTVRCWYAGASVGRLDALRPLASLEPLPPNSLPIPPAVLIIDRDHPAPLRLLTACPPDVAVVVLADDPAAFVSAMQPSSIDPEVVTLDASATPDAIAAAVRDQADAVRKRTRHHRLIIDLDRRIARLSGTLALEAPALGEIVEHLPVGVATLTRDGTVIGMNPAAAHILALKDPTPHARFSSLFEDREAIESLIGVARSWSPVPLALSTTHHTAVGTRALTMTMRRTASQEAGTMLVVTLEDVTERARAGRSRARAERAATSARLRLERIDRTRKTFLAALSHDVRGALSSILGFAETLAERDHAMDAGQRRRYYDTIVRNGRQILSLVEELVDAGLISDDDLNPEPTDIFARLTDVIATIQPAGHVITVETCSVVATIDPVVLDRIVSNLVRNAVRHTPHGCTIAVAAERVTNGIVLRVDDDGPGVPDDEKESIFTAFRRRDASPGSGIGLWLVGRLADAHGGHAWVQDRPGGGASFRARLAERPPSG